MIITKISSIYLYQTARLSWENIGPRSTHFLAYQVTGKYEHIVNGKHFHLSQGKLFFIHQKDNYQVKCDEKGYSLCISFCADTNLPTTVWDVSTNPIVYNLFLYLQQIHNLNNKSNYFLAMSILYEIFSYVYKSIKVPNQNHSTINNIDLAVDYISEHISEGEIKTAKLAELCGISEKYFRTLFKKQYQTTPTQYIIEQRLANAIKFLEQRAFTIAEISEMVGIQDIYYFSKLFKKRFGVSPSKYLQSHP